ncbi:uncharacterized protein LOC129601035 [Paramacrobiotus metropolitanus]|uniref:uncharacterized protein LOC129601035 n=1 Tax=Paramacrobiotus metropolitanus TaxID=2943436 RepID=UPI002445D483|nr:uncharacterized protein LOC129601035 [Paramacrobiotus metropolitanus]
MQFTSINNYLASVVSLHHAKGFEAPDLGHFRIRQTLRGVQRKKRQTPNARLPITPEILYAIKRHLSVLPKQCRKAFWAAALFAFFSLLRKSNLLQFSGNSKYLRVSGIKRTASGLEITVPQIKTTAHASKMITLPLPRVANSPLCPVQAFSAIEKKVMKHPHASPFSIKTANRKLEPLTANKFQRFLKNLLKTAGYDPRRYSLHSFRRGGATFAAAAGVSPDELKAQGTWASQCFERYADRTRDLRSHFAETVSTSLGDFGRP